MDGEDVTTLLPRRATRTHKAAVSLAERLLTPHGIDRYLELVDPLLVRSEIRARVTHVEHPTRDTVTLTLALSRAWRGFSAGQYVRVSVDIDGVRRTRCYSPANSQYGDPRTLELTIKVDPNGLVSRHLHEHAHVGMVLGISHPDGTFTLPAWRPDFLLFLSGGSGITPVLSMLRTLHDEGYQGRAVFLHYADAADEVLYRDTLADLAGDSIEVALGYTATESGADVHGLFTPEHLDAVAPGWREAETYLCGPPGLMDAVRTAYTDAGVSEHLHTEEFTPPALEIDTASATGTVRFSRSGQETANSGEVLLEQAEQAGLRPEHGCRMGICFSCTQVKTSGCVRNALTGEISAEENEEIQLCISVPVGDVDINC
ncbi:MAG: ferredoxin reductase [Actinophytocola sp.]|nr:ferredoxin reductase [Actinophytocola sp.]